MNKHLIFVTPVCGLLLLGCAQGGSASEARFLKQTLAADQDFDTVFDAARMAMRERFVIGFDDAATGVIQARPESAELPSDPTRPLSSGFNVPPRGRRVAEIQVRRGSGGVDLLCRVILQRYDTTAVRAHQLERMSDDQPGATPAERDAGTTAEQNAVWADVERDRDAERQILASIREILDRKGG
jgi:hypothetical protein